MKLSNKVYLPPKYYKVSEEGDKTSLVLKKFSFKLINMPNKREHTNQEYVRATIEKGDSNIKR